MRTLLDAHLHEDKKVSASGVALWPLGHVCVWVVHDQKPFFAKYMCTQAHAHKTHTIHFSISACVYFSFLPCLFAQMETGFQLKLPQPLLFNLCVVLPSPTLPVRCQ